MCSYLSGTCLREKSRSDRRRTCRGFHGELGHRSVTPKPPMKIVVTAGARPNFVKVAPLIKEMQRYPALLPVLIHTGQHYDRLMSEQFFTELGIQPPDINLGVGSGSHAMQTAEVIRRLEPV